MASTLLALRAQYERLGILTPAPTAAARAAAREPTVLAPAAGDIGAVTLVMDEE